MADVSVVIPTRNRPLSLERVLLCLANQTLKPLEIIIVDSSDAPHEIDNVAASFNQTPLLVQHTHPSLCAQRNIGIAAASGKWIFLCDDDVEFSPGYLQSMWEFILAHPGEGAVTGEILEADSTGSFVAQRTPLVPLWLAWTYIFQMTVWANVSEMSESWPLGLLTAYLKRRYLARGNTVTAAGWPLVTEMQDPYYNVMIYGLGASVVRRDWLVMSPYDEHLDIHGIGDNYGVAVGFPAPKPICVLRTEPVVHRKEQSGRASPPEVFAARSFALDYFMKRSIRFTIWNRMLLRWSLVGYVAYYALAGKPAISWGAFRTLVRLLIGQNRYLKNRVSI
jgi:glycosyltransferase involved in cell wall biosynthesis